MYLATDLLTTGVATEPTRVEPMWLLMVGVVGANAFAEATTNEENNRATWAMQAVRLGG